MSRLNATTPVYATHRARPTTLFPLTMQRAICLLLLLIPAVFCHGKSRSIVITTANIRTARNEPVQFKKS